MPSMPPLRARNKSAHGTTVAASIVVDAVLLRTRRSGIDVDESGYLRPT